MLFLIIFSSFFYPQIIYWRVRFVRLWPLAYLFFLDTLNFPFKLIKIVISTSFSKFRQILIELCRQKTSNIWGKIHFQFCHLPTAYYYRLDSKALLERKPAKISCADKVGNQTGYKKQKKGRRRVQEKKWNRFAKKSKAAIQYTDTPKTEEAAESPLHLRSQ